MAAQRDWRVISSRDFHEKITLTPCLIGDRLFLRWHILGLGVSGPQVVEGWYGQTFPEAAGPHPRIHRHRASGAGPAEAPVASAGPHYPLPLTGEGTTGLGKNLKPITHPLRADIPIMLGAEGPKNVALAAEICDGWLPIFYTPRMADTYNEWLDEGFARPGARRSREDFEICATANIVITDDRSAAFAAMKPYLALYMGGMGAEDTNFHADVYRRMGYSEVVDDVTKLFRSNRKDEAATVIPDELVDDAAIVGDVDYVRKQITVWEAAGVTMMVVNGRTAEQIRSCELIDRTCDSYNSSRCADDASQHTIAGTVLTMPVQDPQGQSAHGDVLGGRRRRPATDRLQRPAGLPVPARARRRDPDVDALPRRRSGPVLRVRHKRDGQSARVECRRPARPAVGRRIHPSPSGRPGLHSGGGDHHLGLPEGDGGLHDSRRPSVRVRRQHRRPAGGRHGIPPRPSESVHAARAGAAQLLTSRRRHPRDPL